MKTGLSVKIAKICTHQKFPCIRYPPLSPLNDPRPSLWICPQAFPISSFWLLLARKNGGEKPGRFHDNYVMTSGRQRVHGQGAVSKCCNSQTLQSTSCLLNIPVSTPLTSYNVLYEWSSIGHRPSCVYLSVHHRDHLKMGTRLAGFPISGT